MFRDGFLRFCDDPDLACCRAEKELEQLRTENVRLQAVLAELQELAKAKAEGRISPVKCPCDASEEAQELMNAKVDGRLVELPCKVGDEVWFLEKQLDIANGTCSTVISEYIVTEIRGNKYNPLWYMASSERCTHRDFHPTELGKTVFLSRADAEKAIAEVGE